MNLLKIHSYSSELCLKKIKEYTDAQGSETPKVNMLK